jgi:hypothetical protein
LERLLKILKELPSGFWNAIAFILLPISIGISAVLIRSNLVLYKTGQTEIQLGTLTQKNDVLVDLLKQNNQELRASNVKLEEALKQQGIKVTEIETSKRVIKSNAQLTDELLETNKEIKNLN